MNFLVKIFICLLFSAVSIALKAQNTLTIPAVGTNGSYQTGSVNSIGNKNDGLITTLGTNNCRGWAVFDLSPIPSGATIVNAHICFTTTANSISSSAVNYIGGYALNATNDPSTMGGSILFNLLDANSAYNFNASTWNTNSFQIKTLNASGISFIANNVGGKVAISFVRGSSNIYEIYGYNAGIANLIPQLVVQYTAALNCNSVPIAGNINGDSSVCSGTNFDLILSGSTVASGLTYQWLSKNWNNNNWNTIPGATNASLNSIGINLSTDFSAVVTCSTTGWSDTTPIFSVSILPFNNCYCSSSASSSNDDEILNVTLGGINNSSSCNTLASGVGSVQNKYSNYTNLSPIQVLQGTQVPISIQIGTCGGNYNNLTKVFVDYDHDGSFTSNGEEVYAASVAQNGPHIENGTLTIPLNAAIGITRMRVVLVETTSINSVTSCGNYNWGETEDYLLDIVQAVNCNDTPIAGNILAPNSICANIPISFSATGFSNASNLSFQWEMSDTAQNNWTAIQGINSPSFILNNGCSLPKVFRLKVTCNNSGYFSYSNLVTVGIKPFYLCYCVPTVNIASNNITNVSILGTSLNNTTSAINNLGYTIFYPSVTNSTTTLYQGVQYLLQVSLSNNAQAFAWLDFNGNGTFENSEYVTLTINGNLATATFVVPTTAYLGNVGLRIRANSSSFINNDACASGAGYETEDYIVNIDEAQACNGIPNAGLATAPSTVCQNTDLTLMATGVSIDAGISFQWESTASGTNSWSAITGATNPVFTLNGGISQPTDFRLISICNANEDMNLSNIVSVVLDQFYNCYCVSSATSNSDEEILQFSLGNIANTSTCNSLAPGIGSQIGKYGNYKTLTPFILPIGGNMPFSLTLGTCGSTAYSNIAAIYIDFNQNGSFLDSNENVFTSSYSISTQNNFQRNLNGFIAIPSNAIAGITGLRIVFTESANIDACGNYSWGETEDYLVNLTTVTLCNGLPNPASIISPNTVCQGSSFSINANTYANNLGVTFQWQSATNGASNWVNIVNANDPMLTLSNGIATATYFRLMTSCSISGNSSFSNVVYVGLTNFIQCYCTPGYTNPNLGDQILQVSFENMVNNTGIGNNNGYNDFSGLIMPIQLIKNSNYGLQVLINNGGNEYGGAWIDWNQDAIFDSTEFYDLGTNANPVLLTKNILIPISATTGNTRMRIRSRLGIPFNYSESCSSYDYGETEDYLLNIIDPVPCSLNALSATITAPAFICSNTAFELLTLGFSAVTGINYQWQTKDSGSSNWFNISGATTLNYLYGLGISTVTKFRLQLTCINTNTVGFSNELTITPFNNIQLFTQDSLTDCGNTTLNAASGFSNYLWSNNSISSTLFTANSGIYYCTANSGACTVTDSVYVNILPLPPIHAGSDLTICSGAQIALNATGGNNYQWNNNVVNGVNFTPLNTTLYVVSGIGNNGCVNSDSVMVSVMPLPTVTAGGNRAICPGGSATLTATGADSYLWNTGDTNATISVNTTGNYFVIGTTNYGCIATSPPINVSIKTLPTTIKIKNTGTNIVCAPNLVNFIVDLPNGTTSGFSYQWNQNGTIISGATDSIYNASQSGAYSLTVSGGSNCTKTSSVKAATIKPLPIASFTASGPTTICAGGSVMLNAPAISGYSYSWLKDGLAAGSGNSRIFKLSGIYTVIAKWNSCVDTSDNVVTIVVNPLPVAAVSASTPSTFCIGDSCTINASPAGVGYAYKWMNATVLMSTTTVPIFKATTTATVKLIVIDNNNCTSKTSTSSVKTKVNVLPVASIIPTGNVNMIANGSIKLSAYPSSGVTWQWYKNGNIIIGATNKQYTATTIGNYMVAITKSGCIGYSSSTNISFAGSKNEQTISQFNDGFELLVYPNPFNKTLSINIKQTEDVLAFIQIINVFGNAVFSKTTNEKEMIFDLGNISSGIYFVRYKDNIGRTGTLKVIKE